MAHMITWSVYIDHTYYTIITHYHIGLTKYSTYINMIAMKKMLHTPWRWNRKKKEESSKNNTNNNEEEEKIKKR